MASRVGYIFGIYYNVTAVLIWTCVKCVKDFFETRICLGSTVATVRNQEIKTFYSIVLFNCKTNVYSYI